MYQWPIPQVVRCVSLGLLALIIAGCGESIGTVSGEVKVKMKVKDKDKEIEKEEPLPAGLISFVSQGRKKGVYTGEIKDGKYTVTGVPAAKAMITIQSAVPPERIAPKDKDAKSKDISKPKAKGKGEPKPPTANPKYTKAKTSGLEYDVVAGEQTHNILIDP